MNASSTSVAHVEPVAEIATTRRALDMLLLGGALLVAMLVRLPGFALPLERDEGAYAYVAWNWLQGGLPYRDAFDHKPPLIYLLYMPALLWGTPSAWTIRAWATVLFAAAVALVYIVGRRTGNRWSAALAALIFAVAGSAFSLQGLVLNTAQALVLPALLALWWAIRLRETGNRRFAVAAGAAVAATVLIKPVAIVLVPCVLLASRRSRRHFVQVVGSAALGGLLVALPVAAYFAARGGWNELVFGVLSYNMLYAQESQARWQLGALVDMFAPFVPLLLVALGGIALLHEKSRTDVARFQNGPPASSAAVPAVLPRSGWLVVAWAAALLIAAVGSLRAFVHYYYPILPFLALLAAPCIGWLWQRAPGTTFVQRAMNRSTPLFLAALLIVPFALQNVRLVGLTAEQQAERLYGPEGLSYFAQASLVADFVRQYTQPDDFIHMFGAEPEVYVLSERRAASRYIYDYPIALVPGAKETLVNDLAERPPALLIIYYGVRPGEFNQVKDALKFDKIAQIGGYEIFGPVDQP